MSDFRISGLKALRSQLLRLKDDVNDISLYSGIKQSDEITSILPVLGLQPDDKNIFQEELKTIEESLQTLIQHSDTVINS